MLLEIIDFKSSSLYFEDERTGLKNNTIRKVDLEDERFSYLLERWRTRNYGRIRINKAQLCRSKTDLAINIHEDKMYSFMRDIQHISIWNNLMIITWSVKNGS